MKVLLITSAYPAHPSDSRGTFIRVLARALQAEGLDVTVLAPGAPGAPTRATQEGVEVRRATYWIPRWQGLAIGLWGILPNLRRKPWLLIQVPCLVAAMIWKALSLAGRADVVHAHWLYPAGIAGAFVKLIRRRPLIVTSHGGDVALARRSRAARRVARGVGSVADICLGVSQGVVEQLGEIGIPKNRIQFLPLGVETGVDSQLMTPEAERLWQQFRRSAGLRIVYAGSLIANKSVVTLLDAHALLERRGKAVATLIVGNGPERRPLEARVAENGSRNVFFAGGQPPSTVPRWISSGQVLVLPSLAEGRGLVLLEAMALGLPVIASDIPGPRELILNQGTGRLFTPGDESELADCIEDLLRDPSLGAEAGKRGIQYVEREGLLPDRVARKHVELYSRVLGSGSAAELERSER